jgi:hypothetical protein
MIDEIVNPLVNFKLNISMDVGIFIPLKTIENKVKSFCYTHDLDVRVLKSGFLVKHVEFIITGKVKKSEYREYKEAFDTYFKNLELLSA